MKLLPARGERALPLLSGALLALSYPPLRMVVAPFIGLVPLLLFIAERPGGAEGRWAATRAGLLTGVVYFGLQLYWLAVALIYYSKLAIPAYVGTVLVLAGFTGAFAWAVHYARERLGLPLALGATLFWPALEWMQGHLGDLSFPWLGLGTALAYLPRLAGAADLVGARGLTVWLAAINGMVATLVLRYRGGRPTRALVLGLAALVGAPVAYGSWRVATLDMRPVARVAVVQPDIPEDVKMDPAVALDTSMAMLTRLTLAVADSGVDLVVWPEVAVPDFVLERPGLLRAVERLSARVDAPIVVGTYGFDRDSGNGRRGVVYNSAIVVRSTGESGPRYDKQFLVPFVERVPFIDPTWLEGVVGSVQYFGGLGRGHGAPTFDVADRFRFGVMICYESIFAPLSRRYRQEGASFLVNVTNDAWYGREPWYARTTALWQHPAHLSMRAIETRTGVARAANTGISMFIDPLGRSYGRTRLFEPAVRVGTVYTTDAVTLFVRWGDWLATLATIMALAVIVAARLGLGTVAGPRRGRNGRTRGR